MRKIWNCLKKKVSFSEKKFRSDTDRLPIPKLGYSRTKTDWDLQFHISHLVFIISLANDLHSLWSIWGLIYFIHFNMRRPVATFLIIGRRSPISIIIRRCKGDQTNDDNYLLMMVPWFCVVPHAIFGWDTMLAIVFC